MINDGGAERMVRNRKVEWWQLVAIGVMAVMVGLMVLFFYFTFHGDQLVGIMDHATVKDSYEMLKDVKEAYPELAVVSYEQNDTSVHIEFRYYEEILEKKVDLLAYSYEVTEHLTAYLQEHPDDASIKNSRVLNLRFPDVRYVSSPEKPAVFNQVSYERSEITGADFLSRIGFLKTAEILTFDGDLEIIAFGENPDFSGLKTIQGLKQVNIGASDLTEENKNKLETMGKELGFDVVWM